MPAIDEAFHFFMRILLLLLLFLPGLLRAQSPVADSLKAALSIATSDSARVALTNGLSQHYGLSDARLSREYGLAAEQLALMAGLSREQAHAQRLIGNSHLMMGEYDEAMRFYFKSLRLSQSVNDTPNLIAAYNNLGNVYNKIKDFGRAEQYYQKAAGIAKSIGDVKRLGNAYNNLGDVAESRQDYQAARKWYEQSIQLQKESENKKGLAISLHNMGYLHVYLGIPAQGLPYLFESVELNKEVGNDMIRMSTLGRISELYLAMGQFEQALDYASQSYEMAIGTGSSKKIAEASHNMHAAYASLNDYIRAYEFLQLYTSHSEVLQAESRKKIETELTVQYETEQMEAENRRLKAEQALQEAELNWQRWFISFGVALMMVLLVLLVELYKSRSHQKAAYKRLEEAHKLTSQQQSEIALQSGQLREQNERLEKQSDFQRKVLSIISHDLRGPFASVKGVLGLAVRKSMTEADTTRIFTLLSRDMDVANNMLDNVLVWAKTQLEDSSVRMQPVALQDVAEETFAQVKSHADKKEIALIHLAHTSAQALADKERLSFVLRNLLMNAVKFSQQGGQVFVKTTQEGDKLMLMVQDTGKGIAQHNVSKLFSDKRFSTIGTAGEKGTGLGLMLCKELLESFGGRIWVESTEGIGSTFFVEMPVAIPVGQSAQERAALV